MTPQFGVSLTDDTRVVIYDRNLCIMQATDVIVIKRFSSSLNAERSKQEFVPDKPFLV